MPHWLPTHLPGPLTSYTLLTLTQTWGVRILVKMKAAIMIRYSPTRLGLSGKNSTKVFQHKKANDLVFQTWEQWQCPSMFMHDGLNEWCNLPQHWNGLLLMWPPFQVRVALHIHVLTCWQSVFHFLLSTDVQARHSNKTSVAGESRGAGSECHIGICYYYKQTGSPRSTQKYPNGSAIHLQFANLVILALGLS